jgi:hypothetical protein
MKRPAWTSLLVACFTFVVGPSISPSRCVASANRVVERLTEEERAELARYASDTWRSFKRLAQPSGLPVDGLTREGSDWVSPAMQTSPTNIAAYIWSILAAQRLKLIDGSEAHSRLEQTLTTLARLERDHGFYFNDLDPRTGERLKHSPLDSTPRKPMLSSVDNAWLAMSLTMVINTVPPLRERAVKILDAMDFQFFYDPYNATDPVLHPGQLRVGYWVDDQEHFGHYGMLNSEARIASYLGIARGQLPPDHYYRMFRTLPETFGVQKQAPQGEFREYLGVRVLEGTYSYRGMRIVPSWGGSMFEALMVTLFVPEDVWAPRSWKINHPHYVRGHIEHGRDEAGYGFWGFSPALSPRDGYQLYGVPALGANPVGYLSYDPIPAPPLILASRSTAKYAHGVVTPHASFLALRYAPREALANLRALALRFPIYSAFGFLDSVDVSDGVVASGILALDQGMILAAIANELADDAMQHAFSDGAIEKSIRSLIAMEEFSAGPLAEAGTIRRIPDVLQRVAVKVR